MLLITEINASFLHIFGKIVKGSTDVASVTVLKAVRIIQINGTSIVMDTMISMTCIKIVVNFFFVSILSMVNPPFLVVEYPFLLTDHLEYCQDHGDNKKYYYDRSAVSHVLIDKCIFIEQVNQ